MLLKPGTSQDWFDNRVLAGVRNLTWHTYQFILNTDPIIQEIKKHHLRRMSVVLDLKFEGNVIFIISVPYHTSDKKTPPQKDVSCT
jgi:hypothetical protein